MMKDLFLSKNALIAATAGIVAILGIVSLVTPQMSHAQALPPPTQLAASCPTPGTIATVSWTATTGASRYDLRFDNKKDGWTGSCTSQGGDFCISTRGTSFSFNTAAGSEWKWWVHACTNSGCSPAAYGSDFTCVPQPTPPPPSPSPTPISTLHVSCSANPASAQVNEAVTFTSSVSGGSGNFIYIWSNACNSSFTSCTNTFSQTGTHTTFLTISSGSETKTETCSVNITASNPTPTPIPTPIFIPNPTPSSLPTAPLAISCSANPGTISSGQQAIFTAQASGGTGSYAYEWRGACYSTNQSCSSIIFGSGPYGTGSQTALLTIHSGAQTANTTCQVNINAPVINSATTNNTTTTNVNLNVNQICSPKATFRCAGNALYWYDSCGNQGELYQVCQLSQICQNNQCVNTNIINGNSNLAPINQPTIKGVTDVQTGKSASFSLIIPMLILLTGVWMLRNKITDIIVLTVTGKGKLARKIETIKSQRS